MDKNNALALETHKNEKSFLQLSKQMDIIEKQNQTIITLLQKRKSTEEITPSSLESQTIKPCKRKSPRTYCLYALNTIQVVGSISSTLGLIFYLAHRY